MPVTFTIGFICHNDFDLLEKTIPQNLHAICKDTKESYDVILVVDGAEGIDPSRFLDSVPRWGIDEVRFRWRLRNCAGGDPSNNGHLHILSNKTPYLLTLEGDVVLFKTDSSFDILAEFRALFERHENLALATCMDDYDCWVWKLKDVGPAFELGVQSVNRLSSHFLVYNTERFCKYFIGNKRLSPDLFYEDSKGWFNYEDLLSTTFAYPAGPGIAFVKAFPIKVYHCDIKVEPGSVDYTKDLQIKINEFERRKQELKKE